MRSPENTHKTASRSRVRRTQNESPIRKRGGQVNNANAKKSLVWLPTYDLSTPENIRVFLREVVKATWEGRLGTRQTGAINGAINTLLAYDDDLAHLAWLDKEFTRLQSLQQELFQEFEAAKRQLASKNSKTGQRLKQLAPTKEQVS